MDDGEVTRDSLLGGAVTLLQPRRGHRAGTDAVLLAGYAEIRPGEVIVDLGSASGAVGLMVAHRVPGASVTFVEREADIAELCRRNIALNGFGERARVLELDLFASRERKASAGWKPGMADAVATNPPFFDAGERASPEPGRRAARSMSGGDLMGWIAAAAEALRPKGRLQMIHRADRLAECLATLERAGLRAVELRPVYARLGEPATRVLLRAVKGGRGPLSVATPLVLHDEDGRFTTEAEALHRGATVPT